ncbi:hypothetical protein GQ457_07G022570 [Hibiscus cannabinus]
MVNNGMSGGQRRGERRLVAWDGSQPRTARPASLAIPPYTSRMSRNTASSPLLDQQSSDIGDEGKTLHLLDEETGTLKRQTENNYKDSDSDSDSDSDTDYGSDDGIEITDEQLKIYGDALAASGGFDVPYFPRVVACCLITPIRINTFFREDLKPYCVAGMNHFNQDKNKL